MCDKDYKAWSGLVSRQDWTGDRSEGASLPGQHCQHCVVARCSDILVVSLEETWRNGILQSIAICCNRLQSKHCVCTGAKSRNHVFDNLLHSCLCQSTTSMASQALKAETNCAKSPWIHWGVHSDKVILDWTSLLVISERSVQISLVRSWKGWLCLGHTSIL